MYSQRIPSLALAVHLLVESYKPDTYWRPYIDILPRSFTLPLYFRSVAISRCRSALTRVNHLSPAELDELQASTAFRESLMMLRGTIGQYLHFQALLHKSGGRASSACLTCASGVVDISFNRFRWAVGVCMSRQNSIPSVHDPAGRILALIPG